MAGRPSSWMKKTPSTSRVYPVHGRVASSSLSNIPPGWGDWNQQPNTSTSSRVYPVGRKGVSSQNDVPQGWGDWNVDSKKEKKEREVHEGERFLTTASFDVGRDVWFKDFGVPSEIPYVIQIKDVPPVLFFDIEFVPIKNPVTRGGELYVLQFSAVGFNKKGEEQVYLCVFVDYNRCDYVRENLDERTFKYTRERLHKNNPVFHDGSLEGHITLARLSNVLTVYCSHVRVWIGFDVRNDKDAFFRCLSQETRSKITLIDMQKELETRYGHSFGRKENKDGSRGQHSLKTAVEEFCSAKTKKRFEEKEHDAVFDSLALLHVYDEGRKRFPDIERMVTDTVKEKMQEKKKEAEQMKEGMESMRKKMEGNRRH